MRLSFEHLLALAGALGITLIQFARAADIQLGMFTESGPNLFSALILSTIFELSFGKVLDKLCLLTVLEIN